MKTLAKTLGLMLVMMLFNAIPPTFHATFSHLQKAMAAYLRGI